MFSECVNVPEGEESVVLVNKSSAQYSTVDYNFKNSAKVIENTSIFQGQRKDNFLYTEDLAFFWVPKEFEKWKEDFQKKMFCKLFKNYLLFTSFKIALSLNFQFIVQSGDAF